MGRPKNHMKTFGFWFYEELVPIIGMGMPRATLINPHGLSFQVNMSSTRLECFKRTPKCAHCKRVGVLFLLQSHKDERPHLNLYAVERKGGLVLMTQDHIIPQSKGGSSEQDNLQTMCTICNQAKGCKMPLAVQAA